MANGTTMSATDLQSLINNAMTQMAGMPNAKTMKKGGGKNLPPMQTTTPEFKSLPNGQPYQRQDPAARQALIQAMVARSRGGGMPPASTGA